MNLGHRRIAVIRGPDELFDSGPRWEGVCRGARECGIAFDQRLVFRLANSTDPNLGFEGGVQFAAEMLATKLQCTAVLAFDDLTALGVIRGLTDAGVRIPEDCSVVGFDDILQAAVATPAITTVRQPLRDMGLLATEWVLNALEARGSSKTKATLRHMSRPELIARDLIRGAAAYEAQDEPIIAMAREVQESFSMKASLLCVASVLFPLVSLASTTTPMREGWKLQSACKLNTSGTALTKPGVSTDGWLKATVPTTVLAAQAAAGAVPDPYFGSNLRQLAGTTYPIGQNFSNLPMAEDSPYRCGWWYRTEFAVPTKPSANKRVWLKFGGINYRAEIWLNGHQVADSKTVAGAYRTYEFDVTDMVGPGQNVLAVETFAPTEKDLGINWVDWNPCPPDKDMGLWGAVDLVETGAVTIDAPSVVTHFTDGSLGSADLTVYGVLHNTLDHPVHGTVAGSAAGARFEKVIELGAHESREVSFSAVDFPALHLRDPKLWWPRQMGDPHLSS